MKPARKPRTRKPRVAGTGWRPPPPGPRIPPPPVVEPITEPAAEPGVEAVAEPVGEVAQRGTVLGILAGVVVLTLGLTAWFVLAAGSSRESLAGNTALVDVTASNAVIDQVGRAVRTAFSYDATTLARTKESAREVLSGQAIDQYTAQADRLVAQNQVVTTAVRSIGIIELRDADARLLLFVDRQLVRGEKHESAAAQLIVTAHRTGDRWLITDLHMLS